MNRAFGIVIIFAALTNSVSAQAAPAEDKTNWRSTASKAHTLWQARTIEAASPLVLAAQQALEAAKSGQLIQGDQQLRQLENDLCDFSALALCCKDEKTTDARLCQLRVAQWKLELATTVYGKHSVEYWHALIDLAPHAILDQSGKARTVQAEAGVLQLDLIINQGKKEEIDAVLAKHKKLSTEMQTTIQERFDRIKQQLDKLNAGP